MTRTVVEPDDPAFRRPSKPIGGFYAEAEARQRMAADLGAQVLLVLTGVEHVALDFGRPTRRDLHAVRAGELARHADAGQFAAGSMLPKLQAAIRFLARGGRRAVITTPELSEKALAGEIGTQVLP